jgi:hypothetical protein
MLFLFNSDDSPAGLIFQSPFIDEKTEDSGWHDKWRRSRDWEAMGASWGLVQGSEVVHVSSSPLQLFPESHPSELSLKPDPKSEARGINSSPISYLDFLTVLVQVHRVVVKGIEAVEEVMVLSCWQAQSS